MAGGGTYETKYSCGNPDCLESITFISREM